MDDSCSPALSTPNEEKYRHWSKHLKHQDAQKVITYPFAQQALIEHHLHAKLSSKLEEQEVNKSRHNFCTYGVFGLVGETGTVVVWLVSCV